ncbi:hypothetical protein ACQPYK_21630 [Streptosporangium sp. CA-135522]
MALDPALLQELEKAAEEEKGIRERGNRPKARSWARTGKANALDAGG